MAVTSPVLNAPELADRADQIDRRIAAELGQRLLKDTPSAVYSHIALMAVVTVLLGGRVATDSLVVWFSSVGACMAVRWLVASHLRTADPLTEVRPLARLTVMATAVAWGVGAAILFTQIPIQDQAIILVVFAGAISGASTTLNTDPGSFYGFLVGLLVPVSVAIAFHGWDRPQLSLQMMMVLYASVMVVLFRRSHNALVLQLRTAMQLEWTEQAGARERAFLSALIDSVPIAVAVVDHNGRVHRINPGFERLFGYQAAEAVGVELDALIVPEVDRSSAQALSDHVRRGSALFVEVDRRRKDGAMVKVHAAAATISGSANTFLVLYEDITERLRVERELREAEERYRVLVQSASDLVWSIDSDGRFTFVNAASERIYGVSPDQLIGQRFLDRTDPAYLERDGGALVHVMGGGELTDYETVHLTQQGEPRRLSTSALPARNPGGKVVGVQGIARDVTVQAAARETLEQARIAAQRAAMVKATFLANVSHEIRTPMNGILGMIGLLMDTDLNPEQRETAGVIRGAADSLLTIINDLLDFSKAEAGRVALEVIPFDLPKLVDAIARPLALRAGERSVELACDVQPGVPTRLCGDPGRLRQVLTNLVGNAVKFTHQGEVVVTVTGELQPQDKVRLRFNVRDTGIGIAGDKLDVIFDEFQQADPSTTRQYGGTGLGLAITRQIVRAMGGDVSVESELGRGSDFSFEVVMGVDTTDGEGSGTQLGVLRGARILVVDDNATNRRIVKGILEWAGAEVREAEGADIALTMLRKAAVAGRPFALLATDGRMPKTDGFQLAAEVRADSRLSGIRILLLTSSGQRGDAQRARDLGIEGYLTKPIARSDLLEAMSRALQRESAPENRELITRHSIAETRRQVRILLAEDNAVNQMVAVALLKKRGHDVDVAADGRKAVEAVAARQYDVVLMDIQMPELDGLKATELIRRLPGGKDLPIVAVTANVLPEERAKYVAAGMNGYLAKPFQPHELFAVVEGWGQPEPAPPAKVETKPDGLPPVDLVGFRASLRESGVEDAADDIIATFLDDAPARWKAIEEAVASGDPKTIERSAHAFKSAAASIRAAELADLLKALEMAGRAREPQRAVELVKGARKEVESVTDYLTRNLKAPAA